jgi:transposase
MEESHSNLPDDVDALRAIIAAQADQLAEQALKLQSRDTLIDKLKAQLAVLKRSRFGSSSEKMDRAIEQLELALEDIEAAEAEAMASVSSPIATSAKAKPSRQPLPDHLPRHDVTHEAACSCPVCGGSDY